MKIKISKLYTELKTEGHDKIPLPFLKLYISRVEKLNETMKCIWLMK